MWKLATPVMKRRSSMPATHWASSNPASFIDSSDSVRPKKLRCICRNKVPESYESW